MVFDGAALDDSVRLSQASGDLARNVLSLRRSKSLTQAALAKLAGVPRSTIAHLESGDGNPTLHVLLRLAQSLQVPLEELLAPPRAKVRHFRGRELGETKRPRGVTVRPLVPEPTPNTVLVLMEFEPGAVMSGAPHLPGTREYFTCIEGRLVIFVAGDRHELETRDVLAFPGHAAHSYQNPGPGRTVGASIVLLSSAGV